MSNPYYDSQALDIWRKRIARLRLCTDMPAPWDVDPDVSRWRAGLGHGDTPDSQMLDWSVWLRSLNPDKRVEYRARRPEPDDWTGLYDFVLRPSVALKNVPEDRGADVYWDSLLAHYESVFGTA